MKRRTLLVLWIAGLAVAGLRAQTAAEMDSTFWPLSIQEILEYRNFYTQELEWLQTERRQLIQRGIDDGERLLAESSRSAYMDDILIRLADLYTLKEKDDYLDSMKVYDERLARFERAPSGARPVEPAMRFDRSMAIFQRILDEFPDSEFIDDALYNQAFLYEEMGSNEQANRRYERLIETHPDSRYAVEANLRLGEYYFNPPVNDLNRAIAHFQNVLKAPGNPRTQEALYKLGWSHFRLNRFSDAISYFTVLVESIDRARAEDGSQPVSATDLRQEALDYIAVAFVEFGNPDKVRNYFQKLGNPAWSKAVYIKLGQIYMEDKESYRDAVATFRYCLEGFPMDPDAPVVQKKMADCHMLLHDEAQALDARRALFQNYKPGSSWWNATSDEKSRTEAYRLCEQALRDNFNAHVRKAETPPGDTLSYAQAVRTARTYLESFPEDPNALPVRWNLALVLDTKLGRFKDALLEYLTISMAYTGDAYVSVAREKGLPSAQDAAENAIVMADSLARREAHGVPPDAEQPKDRVRNGSGQSVVPFSEAEKWLAMAYDNYIKQFPFDSKTQDILANAGVLYFSHYEYNDALRYFKTLVKNFPNAAQIEKVRYSILQSYLGNNDFGSAELLAKKVLQENPPAAELALWGLALGQSIFKNAEDLSRRNEAKAAGDEFYRMVLETPKVDFADRALFNAGREYEKIRDFNSAIRAYERLRIAYPSSPLLADALTNLAFDYGERGDALLCANRYEELAVLVRDGNRAKDALFNALLFYIKAEQWNKAVDLGELYGMRYPEAEDAPAIAFRAAEHCARIPDSVRAARMWSDFPLRFPRSGLGVEAYYRLGVSASDQEAAERWFVRSVSRHDSLVAVGLPGNLRIASEALYAACRLRQARFERIRFTLPDASMQEQVQGKQSLLQQLTEGYAKLAAFRTERLPESLYRIGETYEEFARAWAVQEMPVLDPIAKAIKEKTINERTSRIYREALAAYLGGLRVLDRLLLEKKSAAGNGSGSAAPVADTVYALARSWSGQIHSKISEMLFRDAEIRTETIQRLLSAPVPGELNNLARLEYRSQVLVKVIKPQTDAAVDAHRRNLVVSDSLGLVNAWVDSSRSRILPLLCLMSEQYRALAWDALRGIRRDYAEFDAAVESRKPVSDEWADRLLGRLEMLKSYGLAVLVFAKDGLARSARIGIRPPERVSFQDAVMRFAVDQTDTLEARINGVQKGHRKAVELFQQTKDPGWENCTFVFEDAETAIREFMLSMLREAFAAEREFEARSPSAGWVAVRLVQMDASEAEQWDLKLEEKTVRTDTTWGVVSDLRPFPARSPRAAPDSLPPLAGNGQIGPDSGMDGAMAITGSPTDTLFARYAVQTAFEIPGFPAWSQAAFMTDTPVRLTLNGTASADSLRAGELDVTKSLRPGKNAVRLEFGENKSFRVAGAIRIRYLSQFAVPQGEP